MTYEKRIVRVNNSEVKIVIKHFRNGNITRVIHSIMAKLNGRFQTVENGLDYVKEHEINEAIIESFEHVKQQRYACANH